MQSIISSTEGRKTGSEYSNIASLYHKLKKKSKADRQELAIISKNISQQGQIKDPNVEKESQIKKEIKLPFSEEILKIHSDLLDAGILTMPDSNKDDPKENAIRNIMDKIMIPVEGVETDSPTLQFPMPLNIEEATKKMNAILENHKDYIAFEAKEKAKKERWGTIKNVVAFTGGVALATGTYNLANFVIQNADKFNKTLVNYLSDSSFSLTFDMLIISYKVLGGLLDSNLTMKQKLKTLMAGGMKLATKGVGFAAKEGAKNIYGGVILTAAGGIGGVVILSGVSLLSEVAIHYILLDHNVFKEKIVEQAVRTDEDYKKEFEKALKLYKAKTAERFYTPYTNMIMSALTNHKVNLMTSAILYQTISPYRYDILDTVVDAWLIQMYAIPYMLDKTASIFASEFVARKLEYAKDRFSKLLNTIDEKTETWTKSKKVIEVLAQTYKILHINKLIAMVVRGMTSVYLAHYLKVGNFREAIVNTYDKAWGTPIPEHGKTYADLLDQSTKMEDYTNKINLMSQKLENAKEELQKLKEDDKSSINAMLQSINGMEAEMNKLVKAKSDLSDFDRAIKDIQKMPTKTVEKYKKNVLEKTDTYQYNLYGLALHRLKNISSPDDLAKIQSLPTGERDMAAISMLLGKTDFKDITIEDIKKWQKTRWPKGDWIVDNMRKEPFKLNEEKWKTELSKATKEMEKALENLKSIINFEATLVANKSFTLENLSNMKTPWDEKIILNALKMMELTSAPDLMKEIEMSMHVREIQLHMSQKSITWDNVKNDTDKLNTIKQTLEDTDAEKMIKETLTEKEFEKWKLETATEENIKKWQKDMTELKVFKDLDVNKINQDIMEAYEKSLIPPEKKAEVKKPEDISSQYKQPVSPDVSGSAAGNISKPSISSSGSNIPSTPQTEGMASDAGPSKGTSTGTKQSQEGLTSTSSSEAPKNTQNLNPLDSATQTQVKNEINNSVDRMQKEAMKNLINMAQSQDVATKSTLANSILSSLAYGGASAASAFSTGNKKEEMVGVNTQNVYESLQFTPVGDMLAKEGMGVCMHSDAYRLEQGSSRSPFTIYRGLEQANMKCFTRPILTEVSQLAASGVLQGTGFISGAGGWLFGGWATKILSSTVNMVWKAKLSLQLSGAELILKDNPIDLKLPLDTFKTEKERESAIMAHLAQITKFNACRGATSTMQSDLAVGGGGPCNDIFAMVDYREIIQNGPGAVKVAQDLLKSGLKSMNNFKEADGKWAAAKALAGATYDSTVLMYRMMTDDNKEKVKLLNLMTYGSKDTSTVRASADLLAGLSTEEHIKYEIKYNLLLAQHVKTIGGEFFSNAAETAKNAALSVAENAKGMAQSAFSYATDGFYSAADSMTEGVSNMLHKTQEVFMSLLNNPTQVLQNAGEAAKEAFDSATKTFKAVTEATTETVSNIAGKAMDILSSPIESIGNVATSTVDKVKSVASAVTGTFSKVLSWWSKS